MRKSLIKESEEKTWPGASNMVDGTRIIPFISIVQVVELSFLPNLSHFWAFLRAKFAKQYNF